MDWVIQKAAELGVDQIVPVHSRHSVVKPKSDRIAHQRARWERIAHDAAQQSERWTLPVIDDPRDFPVACAQFAATPTRGILAERSDGLSLAAMLLPVAHEDPIVLFIGPEGGWALEELQLAQEKGYQALTLGPRILRAETAAIAALSILQSRLDEKK
jgi:16S rRNA (uracil1498-N3)-methyltransferase